MCGITQEVGCLETELTCCDPIITWKGSNEQCIILHKGLSGWRLSWSVVIPIVYGGSEMNSVSEYKRGVAVAD